MLFRSHDNFAEKGRGKADLCDAADNADDAQYIFIFVYRAAVYDYAGKDPDDRCAGSISLWRVSDGEDIGYKGLDALAAVFGM